MLAHEVQVRDVDERMLGWATTESIRTAGGKRLVPKGGLLDKAALASWSEVPDGVLHLIELEAGDLHENIAGRRVAEAVSGDGIEIEGPFHSRYNLRARRRGLLVIDPERVYQLNRIGDVSLFTRYTDQGVEAGRVVAGVKATPIVVAEKQVIAIEELAAASGPIVDVQPFRPKRAAVVATESLHPKLRESFERRVAEKLAWYGGEVLGFDYVDADAGAVAAAISGAFRRGADMMLAAGGNTLDPLDPILQALPQVGAGMVHLGAPADPGSMFWVATRDGRPIFNLASCSMYSEATVIDLMLPLVFAGREITADTVIRLGYGGLLEDDMTFRFPDYDGQ